MDTIPRTAMTQTEWRQRCAASSRLDAGETVYYSAPFGGNIDAYVNGTHLRIGSYNTSTGEGWWHP